MWAAMYMCYCTQCVVHLDWATHRIFGLKCALLWNTNMHGMMLSGWLYEMKYQMFQIFWDWGTIGSLATPLLAIIYNLGRLFVPFVFTHPSSDISTLSPVSFTHPNDESSCIMLQNEDLWDGEPGGCDGGDGRVSTDCCRTPELPGTVTYYYLLSG